MRERPPIAIGLIAALVIGLALSGVLFVLVRNLGTQPIGPGLAFSGALMAVALALTGLWLYGLIELLSLRYVVDRNGIELRTAFASQTIPHAAIRQIREGEAALEPGRLHGLAWPGYMRGTLAARPFGQISVWGTEPLFRQIILVTDEMCYAISPGDKNGFLQRYALRRNLGAVEALPQRFVRTGIAAWSIWHDRLFWIAMLLGLALNLVLATLALSRYSTLPAIIPLHWNAEGQADRLAARSGVFALPAIGAGLLVLNLAVAAMLHQRERLGARLLAWASIAIQVALWAAAWQILGP